jgi:hypothetical protein
MDIDPCGSLITWNPRPAQLGDHQVTVKVSDGNGGLDTQSFTLSGLPPSDG